MAINNYSKEGAEKLELRKEKAIKTLEGEDLCHIKFVV
jgi:hypothetical protein